MPRCGILEFGHSGGSHLECAGLTALCWPAALTQAPTADASKNSQQAFQVHFEDKSLRNVCFKNVANFSVLVWGAVKPAPMKAASSRRTARRRDRWSWLKKCPNFSMPRG